MGSLLRFIDLVAHRVKNCVITLWFLMYACD